MSFVHLHLHTEFSLIDGLIKVDALSARAADFGMPAIAVTEQGNTFSAVKFYRSMLRQGVKPIIGAELKIINEDIGEPTSIVMLCQHIEGFQNLSRLITLSFTEGQYRGNPLIQYEWIKKYNVICIICCFCSDLCNCRNSFLATGNYHDDCGNNRGLFWCSCCKEIIKRYYPHDHSYYWLDYDSYLWN